MTNLIECLTVLLEYLDFCELGSRAKQVFGSAWVLPDMPLAVPLLEANLSRI